MRGADGCAFKFSKATPLFDYYDNVIIKPEKRDQDKRTDIPKPSMISSFVIILFVIITDYPEFGSFLL